MLINRRQALGQILALASVPSIAFASSGSAPILVRTDGVKDVRGLVAAINAAALSAGFVLPEMKPEIYYREFARVAVENVHRASELNLEIPEVLKQYLSRLKVSFVEYHAQVPVLVFFTLAGLTFGMPLVTFFAIIYASMVLMYAFFEPRPGTKEPQPVPAAPTKKKMFREGDDIEATSFPV